MRDVARACFWAPTWRGYGRRRQEGGGIITWWTTASTCSRGKPSRARFAIVACTRASTSATSASATFLRPTEKELSRFDES